jgi:hypothetical protein
MGYNTRDTSAAGPLRRNVWEETPMAEKKALLTGPVEEFVAAMNPKRECKRKNASTPRTMQQRQKKNGW